MYGKSVWFRFRISSFLHTRYYSKNKSLLDVLVKMPKKSSNDWLGIKTKCAYPPSNVYLQVIGSGARGAPSALYLFTDHNRYLFNCGESTQRLALEHKVKVSRLDHIFVTNKSWKNLGGLPGLSITLQQGGLDDITVHGPEGLRVLYDATKGFVVMKELNIHFANCVPTNTYEDNAIVVKYILLHPQEEISQRATSPKRPKLDINKNKYMLEEMNEFKRSCVAFVCSLKKRLGTLNLEKCVEFGIKPGPLLGKLKNGEDVTLPNGKVVRSIDVKTPDDPGPLFIVLEVPDLSYLKESDFSPYFVDGSKRTPVLIVHFTPLNVITTPEYKSFMAKFGQSTKHLLLNEYNTCLGSEAVHRMQYKLNLMDNKIFPLLKDISVPMEWNDSDANTPTSELENTMMLEKLEEIRTRFQTIVNLETANRGEKELSAKLGEHKLNIVNGRTLTKFHLRPEIYLDRSSEPKLHIQDYLQETFGVEGFNESLEKMLETARLKRTPRPGAPEYPKVLFLGTGSSMPGKTRNVSSIAVYTKKDHIIMLDCGEGTIAQMFRLFGLKKANEFLRNLRAIYISHLHADHHIGLLGIFQARKRAFAEINSSAAPLYLIAPGQIMAWLAVYDKYFEPTLDEFKLIPNQNLLSQSEDMTSSMLVHMGIDYLKTCFVSHCPNAFGLVLFVNDDVKITYSGDTIPCEDLVAIGANSTLLIHEATMEDELINDARIKMHSTTSQAIDIGVQMNAKYTILTHFSQRYARIPRMVNMTDNVGIAFDYMEVSLSDLDILPQMHAPLQLMFSDHNEEMEHKALSRRRRLERAMSPAPSGDLEIVKSYPSVPQIIDNPKDINLKSSDSTTALFGYPKRFMKLEVKEKYQSILYRKTMIRRDIIYPIIDTVLKMNSIKDTKTKRSDKGPNSSSLREKNIRPNTKQSYVIIQDKAIKISKENCKRTKRTGNGMSRKVLGESKVHATHQLKNICRNQRAKGAANRPYKPQMAEIKGSFFKEHSGSTLEINKSNTTIVKEKPQVSQNIAEVKRKFLSKQYLDNSKYEKIEGLNWISWK